MRENLIQEIKTEYEAQRAANNAEERRRLAHASDIDPMISNLVAERMRLFQSKARDALANPAQAQQIAESLSREIVRLQGELRDRLATVGLPTNYLQPVYACDKCHDTGYVGEPIRERCECFQRKLRERAAKTTGSGLSPDETFANYNETIYPDAPLANAPEDSQRRFMARLRERCESYAELYPHNPRRNLLLVGKSGLGKTYMLNCIGNRIRERGSEVIKLTSYKLMEYMRASIFDRNPEPFNALLEVPVLLLDDLGVEPLFNNITIEQLFTLLNERSLAGLHTIVSTNLMPDELTARYTERVCSRLFDKRNTTMMQFIGVDVRMR